MACELTTGFSLDCKDGIGGISAIYIAKQSDFTSGVTFDGTTLQVDALPDATIYKYNCKKGTGSFTETIVTDNGNLAYTQSVVFESVRLSAAKRKEFDLLARNHALVVFVQDANSNIWLCGLTRGLEVTAREAVTGTNVGDKNGYTITLSGEEPRPAYRLENFTTTPFDNFVDITIAAQVAG